MNLSDYEMLPGVIASVDDDQHLGRIKVTIPGYCGTHNMNISSLPWVYPITMTGTYQGFTKLVVNAKVWVLKSKKNEYELWYWPMFELNNNTKSIVSGYDGTEVLVSRDNGGNNVYIYYTDSKGIILSVGNTEINVSSNGNVKIKDSNGGFINIEGGNVNINTSSTSQKASRGNAVQKALETLASDINLLSKAANSQTTMHLITPLNNMYENLSKAATESNLCSSNIYVN